MTTGSPAQPTVARIRRNAGVVQGSAALRTCRAARRRWVCRTWSNTSQRGGQRLDRHSQLLEQRQILGRRPAERGQVVTDDHRVDSAKQTVPRSEVAEGQLA